MTAVADSMHELGLGFGMYSDAGRYTCGQYEGSLGHEEIDAKTWASWGVDYLKYISRLCQLSFNGVLMILIGTTTVTTTASLEQLRSRTIDMR